MILATALAALPNPADAQLGGLRRKVAKTVAGATGADTGASSAAAGADAPVATRSPYGEYVLEMNADVLDRVEKGLATETARRAGIAAILEKQPSPEEREQCEQRAAMLPEMQKLLDDYLAGLEKAGNDNTAAMKAAGKMDARMREVINRECGDVIAPDRLRDMQREPAAVGAAAAGLTEQQYAIIKERITPFCTAGQRLVRDGGRASVPVDARNSYLYSELEVEALAPRCDRLAPAVAANS